MVVPMKAARERPFAAKQTGQASEFNVAAKKKTNRNNEKGRIILDAFIRSDIPLQKERAISPQQNTRMPAWSNTR